MKRLYRWEEVMGGSFCRRPSFSDKEAKGSGSLVWIKSESGESLELHGHPGEQVSSIFISWRDPGVGTWPGQGSSKAAEGNEG